MAGSHDPRDSSASSLPRVLPAALYAAGDPGAATALAAECSRTTHQSPIILDACRLQAAMIVCGLQGQPAETWLTGLPEPTPSCWSRKPLRKEVAAVAAQSCPPSTHGQAGHVLRVLADARRIAWARAEFEVAMSAACRVGRQDAALYCAIVGTLFGLRRGPGALPPALVSRLAGSAHLDAIVRQFGSRTSSVKVVA
jgi:ADP-ribosylglycohydrolase